MNPLDSAAVRPIDPASAEAAVATLTLGFSTDPAARWPWPHPADYLRNMPLLVRAFGGRAFALGTADGIDGLAGVALWLPPGTGPDNDALAELTARTAVASMLKDADKVFAQMTHFHLKEPHWYLPLIAVDPARQGQGLGDKLMAHALARCDADGLPAYLESSNPRNLSFYERHGFTVLGRIQAGSSPTLVPMLRKPRPRRPAPGTPASRSDR